MSKEDHGELLAAIAGIKGRFMLSGYRPHCTTIVHHSMAGRRVDFELPNNAAGGKSKRRMTECVWMNY